MQELKNLIVKTELVDWRLLKPFQPDSLKKTTKERLEKLENSLLANGFAMSFYIFQDANGSYWVIDGHHRLKALNGLEKKGYDVPTHFPCAFLNVENETHAKKLVLAFNSHYAELTKEGVEEFIEGLNLDDLNNEFELFELGFKLPEIKIEEEFADDLPEDPPAITQEGDLYEIISGDLIHRILCGDSTDSLQVDRLLDGKKIDMVFTDPPYELDTKGGGILKEANSMRQIEQNNISSFDPSVLYLYAETNIFCHNKPLIKKYIELAEKYKKSYDLCFYKKENVAPNYGGHLMTDTEYICIIGKQNPNKGLDKHYYSKCFIGKKDLNNKISYSKPVELCTKFIKLYSTKFVLDLFMGTGSTLISCEQNNRNCYGVEILPNFVDLIIQRFVDYKLKKQENFKILKNKKDITNEFLK